MRPEVERAIKVLQKGDSGAVERALHVIQSAVFSFSMKVCGHREDAEDTSQEVLLKSIPYLSRFTSPQALGVWLYKVAKNQCLMGRRSSRFVPQRELSLDELMPDRKELEQLASTGEESQEATVLRAEDAGRLREAILRLPPGYRLILVLHDMEELSAGEVAKITGLREGTVRVRLHRARLLLRKELSAPPSRPVAPRRGRHPQPVHKAPARCKRLFAKLSDYLDGELDDELCRELEKHLAGCAPCEAFLSSLEQTVKRCREYRVAPPAV